MSRTYRKREERYWATEEEYNADSWMKRWNRDRSHYAAVAYYYSDSQTGMWQIPKHWKKDFRIRPFRSAERMAIRKEMQAVDRGTILYPIKKQFDEYYW